MQKDCRSVLSNVDFFRPLPDDFSHSTDCLLQLAVPKGRACVPCLSVGGDGAVPSGFNIAMASSQLAVTSMYNKNHSIHRFASACGRCGVFGAESFDLNPGGASFHDVERFGRTGGKVYDSALDERAAVIDAHDHIASVSQVGYPYPCAEWQGGVCCGQVVHIEFLAVRRGLAVEVTGVKRGLAFTEQSALDCLRRLGSFGCGVELYREIYAGSDCGESDYNQNRKGRYGNKLFFMRHKLLV